MNPQQGLFTLYRQPKQDSTAKKGQEDMTREEARTQIRDNTDTILMQWTGPAKRKVNGKTSYICPICGHGKSGDGLTFTKGKNATDPHSLKCFGCSFVGDIIRLHMQAEGTDYNTTLTELSKQIGITIDSPGTFDRAISEGWKQHKALRQQEVKKEAPAQPDPEGQQEDFREYIQEVQAHIEEAPAQEYLNSRGISIETAKRYGLGYDASCEAFKNGPALVFCISNSYISARNMDSNAPKDFRYRKKGTAELFNQQILYTSNKPICITEGEIDALSIIEAGGQAVGLGSTAEKNKLIELLSQQAPAQPLILALDADEQGQPAEEWIAEELKRMQIPFYRASLNNGCKDENEALQKDKQALTDAIQAAEIYAEDAAEDLKAEQEAEKEAERQAYMQTSAAYCMEDFLNGVSERASTPAISTGFKNLDELLDGGLYAGLYFIGAISSLGKTSFALQLIDQVAQSGQDCIIFSLEMAREELIAKSISRLTYRKAQKSNHAKTTRGILAGAKYKGYSPQERQLIAEAENAYFSYAEHIYIHEGVGNIGVTEIAETVKKHIQITGNTPVVLIDYLQILAPVDMRATDKQNTDKAVLELKRLSRDFKIPVIAISSFNRDNYTEPVSMACYKESGAIEYSSDTLIGLQYNGMDYRDEEKEPQRRIRVRALMKKAEAKANAGEPQNIELKVLKNRNGKRGKAYYSFYAKFNTFCEGIPLEEVPLPSRKKVGKGGKDYSEIFTSVRPD